MLDFSLCHDILSNSIKKLCINEWKIYNKGKTITTIGARTGMRRVVEAVLEATSVKQATMKQITIATRTLLCPIRNPKLSPSH